MIQRFRKWLLHRVGERVWSWEEGRYVWEVDFEGAFLATLFAAVLAVFVLLFVLLLITEPLVVLLGYGGPALLIGGVIAFWAWVDGAGGE